MASKARHVRDDLPRRRTGFPARHGLAIAVTTSCFTLGAVLCGGDATSAAWSDSATATVQLTAAQWEVTAPGARGIADTVMRVSWRPADGHEKYRVEYSTSSNFADSQAIEVGGTQVDVTGLTRDTTYWVRVRGAVNSQLPWSVTASALLGPAGPGTLLAASDRSLGVEYEAKSKRVYFTDNTNGTMSYVPATGGSKVAFSSALGSGWRDLAVRDNDLVLVRDAGGTTADGLYLHDSSVQGDKAILNYPMSNPQAISRDTRSNSVWMISESTAGKARHGLVRCKWDLVDCAQVLESPIPLFGLDFAPGSPKLWYTVADQVRSMTVDGWIDSDEFAVPGLALGAVHGVDENSVIVSEASTGIIWQMRRNPSTGAVSTRVLADAAGEVHSVTSDGTKVYFAVSAPASGASGGVYVAPRSLL